VIEIDNLSFSYKEHNQIFKDFSIRIDSNFFGLIGVNGAGKSTLLKLCLGFLANKSGKIFINGIDVNKSRQQVLMNIGVVHENPRFPQWTRILDYIQWVGRLRGLSRNESRAQAENLCDRLDLLDKNNDHVSTLSAGLTQRFAIAQAVIGIPRLIFLDEPTANLDVRSRYQILDFLYSLSEKYETQILIMSHILSDLERYCDRIAILHEGEIRYQNDVAALLSETKTKQFAVKGGDEQQLTQIFDSENIKIMRLGNNELIVETDYDIAQISQLLPENIFVTPHRSKLEQIFLEVTGIQDEALIEDI
jgi:ABC-2 type transport system ATP-binding protein